MASTSVVPTPRRKRGIESSEAYYSGGFDCVPPPSKRLYRSDRREAYIKALEDIRLIFPEMDDDTLRSVLDSCPDIDAAIDKLTSLRIASQVRIETPPEQPKGPEEWVEALVNEMRQSRDVPEARERARRALTAFEHFIQKGTSEKVEKLDKENSLLKRAVTIQAQRLQESRDDISKLKREVEDYKNELKKAHLTNYSLSVHLRQSNFAHNLSDYYGGPSSSSDNPGNNPDVF